MSQYLVKVGLDVDLHYYGKTLSLCGSCIHLHAASTVFADSYRTLSRSSIWTGIDTA